jgi:hypothetical protein
VFMSTTAEQRNPVERWCKVTTELDAVRRLTRPRSRSNV